MGMRVEQGRQQSFVTGIGACLLLVLSLALLLSANPAVVRAGAPGGMVSPAPPHPYRILFDKRSTVNYGIDIHYRPHQNAVFEIEPNRGCVKHLRVETAGEPQQAAAKASVIGEPICTAKKLNLKPYLRAGVNRIALTAESTRSEMLLYVTPVLFGANAASTLGCLGILTAVALVFWCAARKSGLDRYAVCLLPAGLAYYALWLHLRPNLAYTNDVFGHIHYLMYMVTHWLRVLDFQGGEHFQPPLYYLVASWAFKAVRYTPINPLTAVRFLSLLFYMVFCLYALRTLREAVDTRKLSYRVGALLIVFWPVGIIMATRISNDIMLYALWSAIFYYTARWHRRNECSSLWRAIALLGVAFMVKSTSVVLAAIIAAVMLHAWRAGQWRMEQLRQKPAFAAFGVLLLGIIVNLSKLVYMRLRHGKDVSDLHFGKGAETEWTLGSFARLDWGDYTVWPFVDDFRNIEFPAYFLKTMLYGEFKWPMKEGWSFLPFAMNYGLLALLVITLLGIAVSFLRRDPTMRPLAPHLAGVLISVAAVIAFTMIKRWAVCQDFRFVLPMLVPLVVLFVHAAEALRAYPAGRILYGMAMGIGVVLPLSGAAVYLSRYASF